MTSNILKFINRLSRQLTIQVKADKEVVIETNNYNEEGYLMSADVVRVLTIEARARGRRVA